MRNNFSNPLDKYIKIWYNNSTEEREDLLMKIIIVKEVALLNATPRQNAVVRCVRYMCGKLKDRIGKSSAQVILAIDAFG